MNINEKLFVISADHLMRQGRKAENYGEGNHSLSNVCAYRTKDNLKCAIGVLIADDHYSEALERFLPFDHQIHNAIALTHNISISKLDKTSDRMFSMLQGIHDYSEPSEWAQKLTDLAAEMGFDWSAPVTP
jgi:hypothetical protein